MILSVVFMELLTIIIYKVSKNFYFKNIIILFLSFIIVILTLYLPVTIYRQEEFSPVSLGSPFPFIHQFQTYTPPFPWNTSISTPWEHPTQVLWHVFVIDVIIIYIIIFLILKIYKIIKHKKHKVVLK